jgi:CheY-like chemotaxis protein
MSKYKEVVILVAEDDDGHAELIVEGLRDSGVNNEIIRFEDGQALWDYVTSDSILEKKTEERNFLLLLDINMPRMDGVELLQKMKSHPELRTTPVIMLTTTDDPFEVENCYALGCNAYVTKPIDFMLFTERLQRLGLFLQIIKI